MSVLLANKEYIARVVSYDEVRQRGMLELSETYDHKHVPFRLSEIRMNLTQPENASVEPDHMVVFRFDLERRFELADKPFYFGGCV